MTLSDSAGRSAVEESNKEESVAIHSVITSTVEPPAESLFRKCAVCGTPLEVRKPIGRPGYYCTKKCRAKANWMRRQGNENAPAPGCAYTMDDDESQCIWDEVTYLHESKPVERHEAVCMHCAFTVDATDREGWRQAIMTLRCQECGGRMLVQPMYVGQINSPQLGSRAHFRAHPSRPVPTGRTA